jgi:twitching motility protein PilT
MTKLVDINFSDIYLTPEGRAFVSDGATSHGLRILNEAEDIKTFYKEIEIAWGGGRPSYSFVYDKNIFRVERVQTLTGTAYNARKMPRKTPEVSKLGLPDGLTRHLLSLNRKSGLILWGGPTGMGKTTSVSSLLKKFLEREGGFAYTIEDPPELPLDGVYNSKRGGLGLCKQTEPPNADWGYALKSALRSRPHYILVGEIRSPEAAGQLLRAATSGHLVLSTIHANSVEDAINSIVKYASAGDMSLDLAYDLLSRGLLGVVHQRLQGTKTLFPQVRFVFTNPDNTKGDQVRAIIKDGNINLGTTMEAQMARMFKNEPLFRQTL